MKKPIAFCSAGFVGGAYTLAVMAENQHLAGNAYAGVTLGLLMVLWLCLFAYGAASMGE